MKGRFCSLAAGPPPCYLASITTSLGPEKPVWFPVSMMPLSPVQLSAMSPAAENPERGWSALPGDAGGGQAECQRLGEADQYD